MTRLRIKILPVHIILIIIIFSLCGCCIFPKKVRKEEVRRMLVTAYDAGQKSCGWKRKYGCIGPAVYTYGPSKGKRKKVGITSDGTKAKKGTIAADISRYPYGTKMYVPGYGWGVVHDTGSAIKGDHIDIFFKDRDDALKWGRKYLDVTIIR
ncbi:MAG: 3D domain-containing protein [Proteobacteria bacterium]|nr:3D domain-containing protein [Pseudomonadota bacterium]